MTKNEHNKTIRSRYIPFNSTTSYLQHTSNFQTIYNTNILHYKQRNKNKKNIRFVSEFQQTEKPPQPITYYNILHGMNIKKNIFETLYRRTRQNTTTGRYTIILYNTYNNRHYGQRPTTDGRSFL